MKNKKQGFLQTRKFRYGSVAMIFTIIFIAAIIIFNVIFTALSVKYRYYVDMTKEQIYGITDASRVLLDEIDEQIKIIFFAPFDKLEDNLQTKLVLNCAQEMAKEYKNISIEYIDIIKNPTAVNKYKSTAATNIKTTHVVVETPTDYRVFANAAFFLTAESTGNLFGFQGELKFTSAILQLTSNEHPIVYFTTEHGENAPIAFAELFSDAGYEIRTIDLTKEEIDPNAKIVVIHNPIYDFRGITGEANGISEIEKLDTFLDDFGNLMVFLDPKTPELPELEEFLSEWGIQFGKTVLKDPGNTISTDGYSLVSQYQKEGLGSSIYKDITALASQPKTIVRYARPINMLFTDKDSKNISPVLTTSKDALAFDGETQVEKNQFNLMTITRETRYVDNTPFYSYVLAAGTTLFADDSFLNSNSYGNRDILHSTMKAMGKEKVPVDIDPKIFENNKLDITKQEANNWTLVLTAALPLVVLTLGVIVYVRRKHL